MEINKDDFDDFIERLKFHNRGKGVDDHYTANPIFIVQSLRRLGGIDLDYDPEYFWTDSDHECEWTDEEFQEELAQYVDDVGEHDAFDPNCDNEVTHNNMTIFQKIGYHEYREYVCAHFTLEAAEEFINRKSHDYRELRIYVDSQYWCWEFNSIIDGLMDGKIGLISDTDQDKQE